MSQVYDPGDYNRSGMMAFMFSVAFTLAFFVYVAFVHSGVDLNEIPKEGAKAEQTATPPSAESGESESDK